MTQSIVEISRIVGCSTATVSRALNNSATVSEELRAAVLKAVQDTNYVSKRTRRRKQVVENETQQKNVEIIFFRYTPMERLETESGKLKVEQLKTCTDSKVLSESYKLTNSFYRRILDGILGELESTGHKAVFRAVTNLADPEFIEQIRQSDLAGLLLIGETGGEIAPFINECKHPLVLVDIIYPCQYDVVTTDNLAGISMAFDHLYELGHRKIGFVGRLDRVTGFAERFNAYRLKLAEKELPYHANWVYSGSNHIDETTRGVTAILDGKNRPTAFLCVNDCSAMGVIRAAAAKNISVPGELSVVGFDDQDVAAMVTPALTTVHVPMEAIGMQAVQQLLQNRNTGRSFGCNVRLRPEVVVRQSTAPCRT